MKSNAKEMLQAPRLSESLRVNSCLEFHNPRMLLLKLTQETVAYPQSQLLRFLVQSFLLASICYFQVKQTWKSSFLTHRTSWLLPLLAQPGMEPRSPDFLSLLCHGSYHLL